MLTSSIRSYFDSENKITSKNFKNALKKVAYRGKIKGKISNEVDLTLFDDIDWENMESFLSKEKVTCRVKNAYGACGEQNR